MEKLDELFKLKKGNNEIYKMMKFNQPKLNKPTTIGFSNFKSIVPNFNMNKISSSSVKKINRLPMKFSMDKISSSPVKNFEKNLMSKLRMNVNQDSWTRVGQQKGLSMWGDKDKDKVPNILDCWPLDKKRQGFTHKKNPDGTETLTKEEDNVDRNFPEILEGSDPTGTGILNRVVRGTDLERQEELQRFARKGKAATEEVVGKLGDSWEQAGSVVRDNTKTLKEIFVGNNPNRVKKGLVQSGSEVLQDMGVLKSEVEKSKENKIKMLMDNIENLTPSQLETLKYLQGRGSNSISYGSSMGGRVSNLSGLTQKQIKKLPPTVRKQMEMMERQSSVQPSRIDNITSNVRQGFSLASGATPGNLAMAASIPQHQSFGNTVYQSVMTGQRRTTPTLMNQQPQRVQSTLMGNSVQSVRPSLISGMEIPSGVTLMPGRQIFPETQAIQQITQPQEIPQQEPVYTQTQQTPQPIYQQPQQVPDGAVMSPYSKKPVSYIRGKYNKNKPQVVVQQTPQQY